MCIDMYRVVDLVLYIAIDLEMWIVNCRVIYVVIYRVVDIGRYIVMYSVMCLVI